MRALSAITKAAWEREKARALLGESGVLAPTYLTLKFKGSMVSHFLLLLVQRYGTVEAHEH